MIKSLLSDLFYWNAVKMCTSWHPISLNIGMVLNGSVNCFTSLQKRILLYKGRIYTPGDIEKSMGRAMPKHVFRQMRTARPSLSLKEQLGTIQHN